MQKLFLVLTSMLFPLGAYAAWNVEARSDYERWAAGFGQGVDGVVAGVGGQYSQGSWFFGAGTNRALGKYELRDIHDSTLVRREFDMIGGYLLNRHFSIFGGYRLYRVEYQTYDPARVFSDNIQGAAVGATYSMGITPNIAAFVSANVGGVYSAITYSNAVNKGIGSSLGNEFGVGIRITPSMFSTVSVKYQTMSIDYSPGKWTNSYMRAGARLGYRF